MEYIIEISFTLLEEPYVPELWKTEIKSNHIPEDTFDLIASDFENNNGDKVIKAMISCYEHTEDNFYILVKEREIENFDNVVKYSNIKYAKMFNELEEKSDGTAIDNP